MRCPGCATATITEEQDAHRSMVRTRSLVGQLLCSSCKRQMRGSCHTGDISIEFFPSQLIDVISSCMPCQYSTHCCTAQQLQPCVLLSHVCRLSPRPLPSPRDGPARRLGCTQALATEAAATAPLDESGAPAATRSGPAPGPGLEQRATSLLLATPRAGGLSPCAAASFVSPSVCT